LPHLDLPASRLFYEVHASTAASETRTFVLIHGWACSSTDWDTVLPHLLPLGRVLTVDLRGCGRSTSTGTEFHVPDATSDVVALIDHLGVDEAVLVGHSAGAEVAVTAAAARPETVRACIAVDPGYGVPAEDRARIEGVVDQMTLVDPRTVAAEYFARIEGEQTPPALAKAQIASAAAEDPEVLRAMFRDFAFGHDSLHFRPSTDAFLARLRPPLLSFYRNTERAFVGRQLAKGQHDRVLVYEGSGHWLHQERPARWAEDIGLWLSDIEVTR
jgi:pimeloyl-ACP methyl ester carboxylesterase